MIRFLLRGAFLGLILGGLAFPGRAASVAVTQLTEPADPVPVADLINTSPAVQRDPSAGRLTDNTPDWRYRGLMDERTWKKYGLRPPAFSLTGTLSRDPAAYPLMKAAPVSRERSRAPATTRRRNTQTKATPAKPAVSAPVAVSKETSKATAPVSATPAPAETTATPAPSSASVSAPSSPPESPYSGPGPAVGVPAPAMPQSVARGTVSPVPAPAPQL